MITKDVKMVHIFYYVRCATLIVRVGGMPKTGATYYEEQFVLLRQRMCNQRVLMGVT